MTTNLRFRTLGKSNLNITEIGFGLWAAGGDQWGATDDQQVFDAIDYALEQGMNFYDTADVYGSGHSEELLGQAMRGRRDKFIVATKIGWREFDGEKGQTAYTTLEKFIAGVESNLQRLDTDYYRRHPEPHQISATRPWKSSSRASSVCKKTARSKPTASAPAILNT
jgi:aryl-alcohol dehydrogenase-like predicted oxidoreductase